MFIARFMLMSSDYFEKMVLFVYFADLAATYSPAS